MLINGMEITTMIVDGVPYTTVRDLMTNSRRQERASIMAGKEQIPDWELVKKINCVTASYTDGEDVAANQFEVSVGIVRQLVKLFEKDKLV